MYLHNYNTIWNTKQYLSVVNFLEGELVAIIPMAVVDVLSNQRVRLNSEVLIHFGHVHVVNEVDESLSARGTVVSASFLLQRLLEHTLMW